MSGALTVSMIAGLVIFMLPSGTYAVSSESVFNGTTYSHDVRFNNSAIVNGVDVSYFQHENSNWVPAKKAGVDFAIMRVSFTYAASGKIDKDSKFATHFKKTGEAGIMRGVYVFSQAKNASEGRKEAEYALKRLKALGIGPEDLDLPIYMDYEFYGKNNSRLKNLTSKNAIKAAKAFCEVIRDNGYEPGIYANTLFFRNYLKDGKTLPDDIDLWCAQYYTSNTSGCAYTKWQYTSTAYIKNIYGVYSKNNSLGATDANFWYVNSEVNASPATKIYGVTNLNYTGKPVLPSLEIYKGSKKLVEGTDYVVRGINNVKKSTSGAYAYVRGIGKYKGYALVPIKIGKGYVHMGLDNVGGLIIQNVLGSTYSIGTGDNGAYVRNVPKTITAGEFLKKIKLTKSAADNYRLGVVNAKGKELAETDKITTGYMVGVFDGDNLVGTADIMVKTTQINKKGANYLVKR